MATPRAPTLYDRSLLRSPEVAVDFSANVLESSTEYSIIGRDLEGKILLWNEGARRIYGYEREEILGPDSSSEVGVTWND